MKDPLNHYLYGGRQKSERLLAEEIREKAQMSAKIYRTTLIKILNYRKYTLNYL